MKLAFSTLGVPGLPLSEVRDLATRTGWTGLELISALDEPVHVTLTGAQRKTARDTLGTNVTLLSVNSYVRAGRADRDDDHVVGAIHAETLLAADLGAAAVRVFPGADSGGAEQRMVERLQAAAVLLPAGVEIWLETHDSHATGAAVAGVLDAVSDRRVRAIWDLAHPAGRGEPWRETAAALKDHLAHVQMKDEKSGGDRRPEMLGCGDIDIAPALRDLAENDYPGWISLEWERKWFTDIPPLETALVQGRSWLRDVVRLAAD